MPKAEATVVPAAEVLPEQAPADTAITTQRNHSLSFKADDIDIPRLNVIQKMSDIEGPLGSVVLDKEHVLIEAEEKIPVIVIGATKMWKEEVPYGDEYMPKQAFSEAERDKLVSESDYPVIEYAEIVLLIPQVGNNDEAFPYEIGGVNHQMARITVQKDAYRLTYKRLFTFQTFNPTISVMTRLWSFGSELMSKGKYSWYVPTLSITKESPSEEALEFAERLTQGGN